MATFTPTLRHDKVGRDGLAPLYVAVRHGGRKRLVALGMRVRPKGWNENRKSARKTEPDAEQINDYLAQVVAEGRSELARRTAAREPVTADALAEHLRVWLAGTSDAEEADDFLQFFRRWVDAFAERGQPSTYKAYNTTCNRLKAFTKGSLLYDALTPALLRKWGHAMAAPEPHGEGLKQNYVRKQLTTTRTAIRAANRDGHAPDGFRDPFEKLAGDPLLRSERVEKGRLTADEVRALATAPCEEGSMVEAVRDAFALAFYAGGMRFGDVVLLRWSGVVRDGEGKPVRLSYEAEKTGKQTSIPLVPDAVALLARHAGQRPGSIEEDGFVLPLLDGYDLATPAKRRSAVSARNAYANKVLKKLAKRAGIARPKRVTTHLARHSLAAHLLEAGVGAHGIKEVLRHASVTTTERYLQGFSRDLLDAAYLKAFGAGGE